MQVIQVYMHNMLRNFNYIAYSEKSKEAIFFDPFDIDKTLPIAQQLGLKPKYLLNTHKHHDHIKDNQKLLTTTAAQLVVLKNKERLELADGDYVEALDTPGHVMDHQCFVVYSNHKAVGLISGDALFNAGVGNCKNGGDVATHYQSISHVIKNLDDNIKVYPSHDYLLNNLQFAKTVDPSNKILDEWITRRSHQDCDNEFIITTIGEEKIINPFLKVKTKEEFIKLRSLRDNW